MLLIGRACVCLGPWGEEPERVPLTETLLGGVGAQSKPHSLDPHSACLLGSFFLLSGMWARQKGGVQPGFKLGPGSYSADAPAPASLLGRS